jgi:hypothetical protein
MLLVLTVTHLIVNEWGGLRWHNTNTRLQQNSSSDCPDDTCGQQVDKHDHSIGVTGPSGQRPPHYRVFTITFWHNTVGALWTSDQPDAETSTWQHTALTKDQHPCSRWNSNLQPQQQTHALYRAVIGIGTIYKVYFKQIWRNILKCSSKKSV